MDNRLSQLLQFLEDDPRDAFSLYSVAYEYASREDHATAQTYFSRLHREHPDYLGLYYHYGKTLAALDETDAADAIFTEGLRRAQQQRDAHARAELQDARNKLRGLDYEDD